MDVAQTSDKDGQTSVRWNQGLCSKIYVAIAALYVSSPESNRWEIGLRGKIFPQCNLDETVWSCDLVHSLHFICVVPRASCVLQNIITNAKLPSKERKLLKDYRGRVDRIQT